MLRSQDLPKDKTLIWLEKTICHADAAFTLRTPAFRLFTFSIPSAKSTVACSHSLPSTDFLAWDGSANVFLMGTRQSRKLQFSETPGTTDVPVDSSVTLYPGVHHSRTQFVSSLDSQGTGNVLSHLLLPCMEFTTHGSDSGLRMTKQSASHPQSNAAAHGPFKLLLINARFIKK